MKMNEHVSHLSAIVNFHLWNLRRIRRFIDKDACHSAVRALVTSWLDYGNALLYGITAQDLSRLQRLQNKAAKVIFAVGRREHVTPLLEDLHWLLVQQSIKLSCLSTSTSVYTIKVQDISLTIFISTHHAGLDCNHLQTQPCSPFLNHQNWWLVTDLSIWQDLDCRIQFLQQSGKQPPSQSSRDSWKHISSVKLNSDVHVPIQALYPCLHTLCSVFFYLSSFYSFKHPAAKASNIPG